MCQWIVRRQRRKRKSRPHRLFQPAGIAQSPDQSMMGLEAVGIYGNCCPKAGGCSFGIARGQLFEALLGKFFGLMGTEFGHDIL